MSKDKGKAAKDKDAKLPATTDLSNFSSSTITLTFAIELLNIDIWHDCNEGWLDLGPCLQGIKLQYSLYYGQHFDLDILIWPHTAKIWCGTKSGWVRTWQFLERRWLTFSIRHMFPVRVEDLRKFDATVTPTFGVGAFGAIAKSDKNEEVYFPPLAFGERRYFAPVLESIEETMTLYLQKLIWSALVEYIPPSIYDGQFNVPYPVTDVRNQDTALYHVKETILNWNVPDDADDTPEDDLAPPKRASSRMEKISKDKEKEAKKKPAEVAKVKFELKLSGNSMLAGAGRIVPFEAVGVRPPELGTIIALLSSNNLPALDDVPIVFINIEKLCDIPVQEFKKLRIKQIYTRWTLAEEKHESERKDLKMKKDSKVKDVIINDHYALPLNLQMASQITATFLESYYKVEVRGIRDLLAAKYNPKFFGYETTDRDFGKAVPPKIIDEETDFLIAETKIDARPLAKGLNAFIRGEYSLYPPSVSVVEPNREGICTNDINAVRMPVKPNLVVPSSVVLHAQMSLEVSIGLVGCKPRKLTPSFSRFFCVNDDSSSVMAILRTIKDVNEDIVHGRMEDLMTGFAVDTGDTVLIYLEGPRDGRILEIWNMTEDFYPKMKPVFSSSARYSTRIYPEQRSAPVTFVVLKMHVPLAIVLACPPVYAKPALPLPARSAALKLGRLIASKIRAIPCRCEMPSTVELQSFRLELCTPTRPPPVTLPEDKSDIQPHHARSSVQSCRINWEKRLSQCSNK